MSSQREPRGQAPAGFRRSGSVAGRPVAPRAVSHCFYIQLAHHNFWRDGINTFAMITGSSPSLHVLFHQLHYDGHPWLWYVVLWLISCFTESLLAMKLLQACIGTGILLVKSRSVRRFVDGEKALILAGYFIELRVHGTEQDVRAGGAVSVPVLLVARYVAREARHWGPIAGIDGELRRNRHSAIDPVDR